jgi:hypothetical protein
MTHTTPGLGELIMEGGEFHDPEDEDSPWWLLNFYLELPFHMPYMSGATFNMALMDEQWVQPTPEGLPETPLVYLSAIQKRALSKPDPSPALQHTLRALLHTRGRPDIQTSFDGNLQGPPPLHIATIIEAITPKVLLQSEVETGRSSHPSTYLDRCLRALNMWIRSIAVATGLLTVGTVSRENLAGFMPFFHQRPDDGAIVRGDFYQVHKNPATSANLITTKGSVEKIRRCASSIDDTHGVWKAAEWRQAAYRLAAIEGQYDMAVIALNTALEILVFGIARVLLVDEGKTTAEIDALLHGRLGVDDVCHQHIEHRIGGRWGATDPSCAFGDVNQRVVDIRNQIAHRGHSISYHETEAALKSFVGFMQFVTERVGTKRRKYPRALMDLVNAFYEGPELSISGSFSALGDSIVQATPRYWLPASDNRQTEMPAVVVDSAPGAFPQNSSPAMIARWETTKEQFIRLRFGTPPPEST